MGQYGSNVVCRNPLIFFIVFRNKGMEHLIGSDWKEYFDVLIVQARKPRFFTDVSRPIRVFDEHSGNHIWDRVTKLEKGVIYYEVIVNFFINSKCHQLHISGHS